MECNPGMILWQDGHHGARENMARDLALLARAEGSDEPVLRLFAFAPPGITLGYRQSPDRELDLAACRRDGVEWAVRPTGGRAIFHAREWTYSLSSPLDHPGWGGSLRAAYLCTSELLVAALRRLGVPAELAHAAGREPAPAGEAVGGLPGQGRRGGRAGGPAAPCFASTARHEVVLGGVKLVGSAQRRTARALLQQGSILLGPGHERLVDYLRLDGQEREAWVRRLREASGEAGAYLRDTRLAALGAALAVSFPEPPRRLEGEEGLALLTPGNGPSYTGPGVEPRGRRHFLERSAVD
jgi:lipoate-protein ligase A